MTPSLYRGFVITTLMAHTAQLGRYTIIPDEPALVDALTNLFDEKFRELVQDIYREHAS